MSASRIRFRSNPAVLAGFLILWLAGEVSAGVVVATSLPDGPPGAAGTHFRVQVRVRENDTIDIPVACNFRVRYRSDSVELLSAAGGELGAPTLGMLEGMPPDVFQDVATLGNLNNLSPVPDCFLLTFRVASGAGGLHSILIEDNPEGIPLLARDLQRSIPHVHDNSATTDLGQPPPARPDPSILYSFEDSAEDWSFVAAPPFSAPVASRVTGLEGALELRATDNTRAFGFWESPVIDLAPANSLYTADFFVRCPGSDPAKTPQLRLRSTSQNLQQSRFMTLESRSDGLASPGPEGATCTLVLSPGPGAEQVRVEFELLNFDPNDEPTGILQLDEVRITRRDPAELGPLSRIRSFAFNSGTEGWVFRATPVFSSPEPLVETGRLVLRGNDRADAFGYWSSPELPGGVPVLPSGVGANPSTLQTPSRALYVVTFDVESDLTHAERAQAPQFRLRINEAKGRAASYMAVESKGEALLSPAGGITNQYVLYFLPPASLADKALILSFDYLNFDPTDKATASLKLRRATLEAAAWPW